MSISITRILFVLFVLCVTGSPTPPSPLALYATKGRCQFPFSATAAKTLCFSQWLFAENFTGMTGLVVSLIVSLCADLPHRHYDTRYTYPSRYILYLELERCKCDQPCLYISVADDARGGSKLGAHVIQLGKASYIARYDLSFSTQIASSISMW